MSKQHWLDSWTRNAYSASIQGAGGLPGYIAWIYDKQGELLKRVFFQAEFKVIKNVGSKSGSAYATDDQLAEAYKSAKQYVASLGL